MHFCRKRRGAINSKQLTYLEKYRPKQRLRFKDPHNHKSKCCLMWSALSSRSQKEPFTKPDWNCQSSAFELLLLFWRGIRPTLVYMWDPFTQGLYQLRAVKDEPLEFCLHTQTPIIRVFTNLSWTHTQPCILWHTLVLPAITLYQQHIVQRWSWLATCSSGRVKNDKVIEQNHCMLYSRFCMKLLDYTLFPLSLCLFCNFEILECTSQHRPNILRVGLTWLSFFTLYHCSTLGFKCCTTGCLPSEQLDSLMSG